MSTVLQITYKTYYCDMQFKYTETGRYVRKVSRIGCTLSCFIYQKLARPKAGSLRCMWGQMMQKYSPAEDAGWTMSV